LAVGVVVAWLGFKLGCRDGAERHDRPYSVCGLRTAPPQKNPPGAPTCGTAAQLLAARAERESRFPSATGDDKTIAAAAAPAAIHQPAKTAPAMQARDHLAALSEADFDAILKPFGAGSEQSGGAFAQLHLRRNPSKISPDSVTHFPTPGSNHWQLITDNSKPLLILSS